LAGCKAELSIREECREGSMTTTDHNFIHEGGPDGVLLFLLTGVKGPGLGINHVRQ